MSFRESEAERSSPPVERMSTWRMLSMAPILPLIILGNFWHPLARLVFGECAHEPWSGRWHALWRTARFTCSYCGARVLRLELDGQPFPIPSVWRAAQSEFIATPVGVFMATRGKWRRGHWEPNAYVLEGEFAVADATRGWYGARYVKETDRVAGAPALDPVYRKAGTPDDWCLLYLDPLRWVDPRRLDEAIAATVEVG